jgi:hypothetical protein
MTDPVQSHPLHPSGRAILKASAAALLVALVVLFVAVLPAEYGIDPTGLGRLLHFTRLHAAKTMQGSATAHRAESGNYAQHKVVLRFAPDQGFEYKLHMRPGQVLLYTWNSTGPLDYLFHGEIEGDHSGAVADYERKTAAVAQGSLTAGFEGLHGWAWHNASADTVTLALELAGYFDMKGVIGASDSVLVSSE